LKKKNLELNLKGLENLKEEEEEKRKARLSSLEKFKKSGGLKGSQSVELRGNNLNDKSKKSHSNLLGYKFESSSGQLTRRSISVNKLSKLNY
jgi:hypothetical protein